VQQVPTQPACITKPTNQPGVSLGLERYKCIDSTETDLLLQGEGGFVRCPDGLKVRKYSHGIDRSERMGRGRERAGILQYPSRGTAILIG